MSTGRGGNCSSLIVSAKGLVDCETGRVKPNPRIVIRGDLIEEIGFNCSPRISDDTPVFEFPNSLIAPGLIDGHVHLSLPGDGSEPTERLSDNDVTRFSRAAVNALSALSVGVTTLRDCGGFGDITTRLRDAIDSGEIPGPRLVVSGTPVTKTRAHLWYMGGEVDDDEQVINKTRELVKNGVDFIKLVVNGGGTPGTFANQAYLTRSMIKAAVTVARESNLRVTAHVLSRKGIEDAIVAGVDGLEHANNIQPDGSLSVCAELSKYIAASSTTVTSTLGVFHHALAHGMSRTDPQEIRRWQNMLVETMNNLRDLHAHGVPILFGTDGGWRYTPFNDPVRELQIMAECGLSNHSVLQSATTLAADVLGLGDVIGRLEPGYSADFLVLNGNPLSDLTSLNRIRAVFHKGKIVNVS